MLKRSAYEASGTHQRLAMEVVDDMRLGKIVKQAGFRSGVGVAQDYLVVRWQSGVRNLINGVTKNFFAGAGFSVPRVIVAITALLVTNLLPFAGMLFGHGWVRILSAIAAVMALGMHVGVDVVQRASPSVLLYVADRSSAFQLHVAALHGSDAAAGWDRLARDILSLGCAKARRGLGFGAPSRDPIAC